MARGLRLPLGATVGAALAVCACHPATTSGETGVTPGVSDTRIKIGTWAPLTGPAAQWSNLTKGLEAYFAFINANGGIHGRTLELVVRDDQYDPTKTDAAVRDLVEKESVFAMVGGIGTATGRAVAGYLEEKGVPLFSPASGDRFWTEPKRPNVYTVYPRYTTEGQILGEYIANELSSIRVGVLYQNDDFGRQGAAGIEAGLRKFGASAVLKVGCAATDTDLTAQVTEIAKQSPEVLAIFTEPRQAVTAVKLLATQNKKPHILTSFVLSDPLLLQLGGGAWEGTVTSASTKLATSDDPSVKRYREVLKKYGATTLPVGSFTMAGFVIGMPFVEALQRAGRALTRDALYAALDTLDRYDGGGPYWPEGGLGSPVTFKGGRRQGSDQVYLARATGGKWQKVSDWLGIHVVELSPAAE